MGAEVSLQDIDIAHRVLTRRESDGPKPVISVQICQAAGERKSYGSS